MNLHIVFIISIVFIVVLLAFVSVVLVKINKKKNKDVNIKEEKITLEEKTELIENELEVSNEEFDNIEEDIQEETKEDFKSEEETEKIVNVVNGRKVFVQYNYSFMAKLILSSDEVKQQYKNIINFAKSYNIKTSLSWKQVRIYFGRNTYAIILFKGKKLCLAYNLDPSLYKETKYKTLDLSEIKRFSKTPTLIKLTSLRKEKYALELLDIVFKNNNVSFDKKLNDDINIDNKTKEELIDEGLIKVYTSDEIDENTIIEKANIGDLIKNNISVFEAKSLISDDNALEYVEVVANKEKKTYNKKDIINLDVLSKNFNSDDLVTLESLKQRNLISSKVDYIKVLARGILDKPLIIEANDYSIDAVKMIILTGGEVRKVR